MKTKSLFSLDIHDLKLEVAAESLILDAMMGRKRTTYFVNAHCINVAARSFEYYSVLKSADTVFADGVGMKIASMMAGDSLSDNVNGTDLFPLLCQLASVTGVRMAFMGSRPGVAERCARKMIEEYPGLKVVFVRDGYFDENDEADVVQSISGSKAQILLIAMGVPKQELWMAKHGAELNVPVQLGVGALFDFYSASIPRAPVVLRNMGLEWLFRLAMEPKRMFARYVLGNPRFIARLFFLAARGKNFVRNHPLSS